MCGFSNPKLSWEYQCAMLHACLHAQVVLGLAAYFVDHLPERNATSTNTHLAIDKVVEPAAKHQPIDYPKPDGKLSFDRLTNVSFAMTNHEESQPVHLKLADARIPISVNLAKFAEPAQRYCPAGVYEVVHETDKDPRFVINFQNCVHCKTCDIKDPSENITWVTPQGGDGPNYPNM